MRMFHVKQGEEGKWVSWGSTVREGRRGGGCVIPTCSFRLMRGNTCFLMVKFLTFYIALDLIKSAKIRLFGHILSIHIITLVLWYE